ncbi:MAG: hypothetical protein ACK8QZ_00165 [Anaerolineales bacterium]
MVIQDVEDLIKQLHHHPEWRDALRREILSEELLSLPQVVRDLAEAQKRTEQRLEELAKRVEELADAQKRTEQRLEELNQAILKLTTRVDLITHELDKLRGDNRERYYREHAGAFFGSILRRVRALTDAEITTLVEDALDAGKLSEEERNDLLLSDLILRGCDRQTQEEIYLLVEVSIGIGRGDVERAARRALLLSRLFPTRAVVAGETINAEAIIRCRELGVWQVLDGATIAPQVL